MTAFTLDPQLAADTVPVCELALSEVRLMDVAAFRWLVLVPRRPGLVELTDLDGHDRWRLIDEIALAERSLAAHTACDKLNVGAIGNRVRQLHVHVVARFAGDAAWPEPVWGRAPPGKYPPAERDALLAALRARFTW